MKEKLRYQVDGRTVEREVNYIPVRTLEKCIRIDETKIKWTLLQRF